MFHWICPECGREIAPQVMECPQCDPVSRDPAHVEAAPAPPVIPDLPPQVVPAPILFVLAPEPLLLAAPAPKAVPEPEPEPAPVQPRLSGAPRPPASARPQPVQLAGRDLAPLEGVLTMLARTVVRNPTLPTLEPAAAPQVSQAPLRAPEAARPPASWSDVPNIVAGPEPSAIAAALLEPVAPPSPEPAPANLIPYASQLLAKIRPASPKPLRTLAPPHEQLTLPGPTLPHELTSLNAAGIARILVAGGSPVQRQSSWFLSLVVASLIVAGSLATVFYAVPTLAGTAKTETPAAPSAKRVTAPEPPPAPAIPENPLAKRIEVTGIRFVTDIPDQSPEIHYLVVNHSSETLSNVTVSVTLRALDGAADAPPLSRFSFRTPRLRAYESKEMASSIERFNRPVSLPDWRHVRADIEVVQQ